MTCNNPLRKLFQFKAVSTYARTLLLGHKLENLYLAYNKIHQGKGGEKRKEKED